MSKLVFPPVGIDGQVHKGIANKTTLENNLFIKGAGIELPEIAGKSASPDMKQPQPVRV